MARITKKISDILRDTYSDLTIHFSDGDSINVRTNNSITSDELKEKLFEEIKKTGKLPDDEIKKILGLTDTDNL